jgi:hypothetical protein
MIPLEDAFVGSRPASKVAGLGTAAYPNHPLDLSLSLSQMIQSPLMI